MNMDPGRPEKHDVCRDPELKANPDIAGICVSYNFFANLPEFDFLISYMWPLWELSLEGGHIRLSYPVACLPALLYYLYL